MEGRGRGGSETGFGLRGRGIAIRGWHVRIAGNSCHRSRIAMTLVSCRFFFFECLVIYIAQDVLIPRVAHVEGSKEASPMQETTPKANLALKSESDSPLGFAPDVSATPVAVCSKHQSFHDLTHPSTAVVRKPDKGLPPPPETPPAFAAVQIPPLPPPSPPPPPPPPAPCSQRTNPCLDRHPISL